VLVVVVVVKVVVVKVVVVVLVADVLTLGEPPLSISCWVSGSAVQNDEANGSLSTAIAVFGSMVGSLIGCL
jgi:hypothetical protein